MSTLSGTPTWSAPSPRGRGGFALAALIVANLVPLVGVIVFGWDVREILLLYWAENVVVGFWTAARMLRVGGLKTLPMVAFFSFHFGMFTVVHGIFVNIITSPGGMGGFGGGSPSSLLASVPPLALVGLFISHGVSYVLNFLVGGEWRGSTVQREMTRPYPRLIVLHVAIVASGFFVMVIGQPIVLLILLVVIKTGIDAIAHLRQHRHLDLDAGGQDVSRKHDTAEHDDE